MDNKLTYEQRDKIGGYLTLGLFCFACILVILINSQV